jgi:gas vesicle protein
MVSQNTAVAFFTGLMVGTLVGASSALLLAPQSGEAMRHQIKAKSFAIKDEAVEGLTEAGQQVQAQADLWQEKGEKVAKAVSQSKDDIQHNFRS